MTANRKTLGFGCPNDIDPHHFVVTIPAGRTGVVTVTEHFGLLGGANGIPEREDRAVIPRGHWNKIADGVKRVFNERLKAKKLATSRWTPGANKVERLLGKELCVLAWGIEGRARSPPDHAQELERLQAGGTVVAFQHDRRERRNGGGQRAGVAPGIVSRADGWRRREGETQAARAY